MATDEGPDGVASQFVVGVGASAGGLEALERFFLPIRPTGKLAFAVLQHLSPDFKSVMDELLARHTSLARSARRRAGWRSSRTRSTSCRPARR